MGVYLANEAPLSLSLETESVYRVLMGGEVCYIEGGRGRACWCFGCGVCMGCVVFRCRLWIY